MTQLLTLLANELLLEQGTRISVISCSEKLYVKTFPSEAGFENHQWEQGRDPRYF